MDPVEVAAQGYRGMVLGKRLVVPGVWNKLFVCVTRLLPVETVAGLLRLINDFRGVNRH
jgi:short-subunit dehydrogenase